MASKKINKKALREKRQRKRDKEKRLKEEMQNAGINNEGTMLEKALIKQAKSNKVTWHTYPEEKPILGEYILHSSADEWGSIFIGYCRKINNEYYIVTECHRLEHFGDGHEENVIYPLIESPYWIHVWELGISLFDQLGIVDDPTYQAVRMKRWEQSEGTLPIDWSKVPKVYK